jgi:hypothetical protein
MAEIATLDYGYAFDICAQQVYHSKSALVVCGKDAFFREELSKRLEHHTTTIMDAEALDTWQGTASALIWAAPLPSEAALASLSRTCGGRLGSLYVITAGSLTRLLRASYQHSSDWRAVTAALQRGGFEITAVEGFNGAASLCWGYASRVSKLLKRDEWADRCLANMRADYVVHGWQTWLTTVNLITARKS